jgi:hypothetical protein
MLYEVQIMTPENDNNVQDMRINVNIFRVPKYAGLSFSLTVLVTLINEIVSSTSRNMGIGHASYLHRVAKARKREHRNKLLVSDILYLYSVLP